MTNYDVSLFVLFFEIGTLLGGFIIGFITDFMGGRRFPLIVIGILVGSVFTKTLESTDNFMQTVGLVGFTVGGTG